MKNKSKYKYINNFLVAIPFVALLQPFHKLSNSVTAFSLVLAQASGAEDEPLYKTQSLLRQNLFSNLYDREVAPQVAANTPVTVELQFFVYILELVSRVVYTV